MVEINFEALKRSLGSSAAEDLLDGMNDLLVIGVDRLERAMDAEDEDEKLNPQVTKLIESTFTQAERLAKLRNPRLTHPAVEGPPALPPSMTEAQLTRAVLKRMGELGVPNNVITPEMIEAVGRRVSQGGDFNDAVGRIAQAALAP